MSDTMYYFPLEEAFVIDLLRKLKDGESILVDDNGIRVISHEEE